MLSPAERGQGVTAMPLAMAATGETVECVEVEGGAGLRRHMADLRIMPGTRMLVVSGGNAPGPVVVKVGEGKLMIGRGMAHKILVHPVGGDRR